MDLFKMKKFRKAHKPNSENDSEDKPVPQPEEPKNENGDKLGKSVHVDTTTEGDEDDDDFILDEVKRRLKELRRNSFMVLIPEESCPEEDDEEEEGETSSSEWRDVEAEGRQLWSGFNAVYDKYCERMLFFDQLSAQQLNEVGSHTPLAPPTRSASKKLTSPLRCLSLKKFEEHEDETEHLQQPANDPYQDLETAYVAQLCLTWEALHCQHTLLSQKISCQPESPTCYNHSAQQFQQFQVLLQRFIENEPFEQGLRAEVYARTRKSMPKLLQVPNVQGLDKKEMTGEESDWLVLASDLLKIMESSILTFHKFLKIDKKKSGGVRNVFGVQNQMTTPLQQVQHSLERREMKLKELCKKGKSWKKNAWPAIEDEVELLFALVDAKIISRVLRMVRISTEQLFWCEEKMKKLDLSDGKLQRDPSPILFPCQ
ncbi:hypothetical protein RJ639_018555 [Escallonia herrerae]|uniref:Uncharacterized protein n=1 Tax=Escallonia herrerae TaxID=1293975 RepID=A0AA88V921_9ASTE|nr:hypothetical protein RJ639_018555 [Escallonia herrerae]